MKYDDLEKTFSGFIDRKGTSSVINEEILNIFRKVKRLNINFLLKIIVDYKY